MDEKRLTLENFGFIYKKRQEDKLLEQALVFLKLRQHGCPKGRAMVFAKKKQKAIDGTVKKDGPPGFRKLIPAKPEAKLLKGWLKGQKLKYLGLQDFEDQVIKGVSKQKKSISKYNQIERKQFERLRLKQKQQQQLIIDPTQTKKTIEQIAYFKDQFLKDREKRNLFLSYDGFRLQQYTRNYFQNIQQQNPKSLLVKLGAFEGPINDERFKLQMDSEISKGRSLSSYQIEGQSKRKQVLQFRKSLSNFNLPSMQDRGKVSRLYKSIENSNKKIMASTMGKISKVKKQQNEKQFDQLSKNIDKIVWIKTKGRQSEANLHNFQI